MLEADGGPYVYARRAYGEFGGFLSDGAIGYFAPARWHIWQLHEPE